MDRLVLPVLMSMLWSGSSTKAIYETDKDSGRSFEEVDGATNKISGQNFDFFFFPFFILRRYKFLLYKSWQTFSKVWGF